MNDNIFKYFNPTSKKIILNSQKIANDLNLAIGTDHLLLALLITPKTLSGEILKEYMANSKQINLILKIDSFKESGKINEPTKELKNVLKIASQISIEKSQNEITPEDLLFAIIKFKNCSANKILIKLGINLQSIEQKILSYQKNDNNYLKQYLNDLDDLNILPKNLFNYFSSSESMQNDNIFAYNDNAYNQKISKPQKKSYLKEFGVDLTEMAKENKLSNITQRHSILHRIMQILGRKTKNNPVLIGEPGTGKTAIIESLAQKIINNEVPSKLLGKKIIMLDLAQTVSGTMYRGQFETRIKQILKEAKENKDIILFIDEIHNVIGTGSAEGSMDTANILKPILAKGEIRLIGSTTTEEYRKYIEKDSALERRLQKIIVEEPSKSETLKILKGLRNELEKFHEISISDNALSSAIDLSSRYIPDRFLPDKAIDLVDEAASEINLSSNKNGSKALSEITKKLKFILEKKQSAIDNQDFSNAAFYRSKELKLKNEVALLRKKYDLSDKQKILDAPMIAKVVADWTNIPIDNIHIKDHQNIKNLENKLSKEIIGQKEAIKTLSLAVKKSKTQLSDPERPLGSFIFLGPTGVGKTKLAKVLAQLVFGSEKKLIKIDMSEFMEKHNISRLVGAPPGYIGYDDAGKLTESVRNNPYSVILLDEIEKANPEVFNILLQIIEDGYITDAKGRKVSFRNTIIIMTSNIGLSDFSQNTKIGFERKNQNENYENVKNHILKQLKKTFKPELINRLDNIIIFKPLTKKTIKQIVLKEIESLTNKLQKKGIQLEIAESLISKITEKSYNPEYGAREVRRNIDRYLTTLLAEFLINNPNTTFIKAIFKENKTIISK